MSPCGASTLAEAQAALARREVFGILDIPAGTEREVLAGRRARLPAYVDSAYFLLYNRMLQGILEGTNAVMADLLSRDARPDGSLYRASLLKSSPVEVLNQPLFNPTGGYASYIVPAAFMLILQQTMLMGSATLGGAAFEQGGPGVRRRRGAAVAVLGQGLAHFLLALPGAVLFLVVLPRLYGISATDAAGRSLRPAHSVHAVRELPRPVRQPVVQARRDGGPAFHRLEPAPVLPRRRRPGRSRRSPARSGWRASSFPARRRSMAWCASTRWGRR